MCPLTAHWLTPVKLLIDSCWVYLSNYCWDHVQHSSPPSEAPSPSHCCWLLRWYQFYWFRSTLWLFVTEADADSGVDESTQNGTSPSKPTNNQSGSSAGISRIPKKTPPSTPAKRGRNLEQRPTGQRPPVRSKSVPKPFTAYGLHNISLDDTATPVKKVPMNKIKVGNANSPNLKKIQSKVGSLANASHKPGGGEFKIKSQKLDWKAAPRTDALNDKYVPGGGTKKVFDLLRRK